MARPLSAWRLSVVPLAIITVVMGGAMLILGFSEPVGAAFAFCVTLLMYGGAQLAAARTLTGALARFARVIEDAGGGPPETESDRDGRAVLRWPRWRIVVGGEVHRFHVRRFEAVVGERVLRLRVRRAREGGLAALHLTGRGPGAVGAWDGRLPGGIGHEPLFWAPFSGFCLGVLVGFVLPPWIAIALGIAVTCASLSALLVAHALQRRAMRAFLQGAADAGVCVDQPILLWNGAQPEYLVPTSRGPLIVSWLSLWGLDRLFVEQGNVARRVPRAQAYAEGGAFAVRR